MLFNSERQPEFAVRSEIRGTDADLHVARAPLYPERAATADDGRHVRHTPADDASRVVPGARPPAGAARRAGAAAPSCCGRWAALVPDARVGAGRPRAAQRRRSPPTASSSPIDQEWSIRGYDRDVLLVAGLLPERRADGVAGPGPSGCSPRETVGDLRRGPGAPRSASQSTRSCSTGSSTTSRRSSRVVNTSDAIRRAAPQRSADDLRQLRGQSARRAARRGPVRLPVGAGPGGHRPAVRRDDALEQQRTASSGRSRNTEQALDDGHAGGARRAARPPAGRGRPAGREGVLCAGSGVR